MKTTSCIRRCVLGMALAAVPSLSATEYFVDCRRPDDSGDGLSEAAAKRTVQAAVNLAVVGSTAASPNVVTLLPGDYSEGKTETALSWSRVCITKPIVLRSKGGRADRDVTRILGCHDSEGTNGMGTNAVRCLFLAADAVGSRIEGLTLADGASGYRNNGENETANCGGACFLDSGYSASALSTVLVDCRISNSVATRGGGVMNVALVRCLVDGNKATASGSAGRQVHAFNSVFEGNRILGTAGVGVGVVSYVDTVVNCTFVNNDGNSLSSTWGSSQTIRNVLVLGAGATGFNGFGQIADYCFTDSTTPLPGEHSGTATADELFSPASGDWRLATGAAASSSGEVAALDSVPSDYRDVDFYGRPRKTGETVSCGAAEESVVPFGGRLVFEDVAFVIDGHTVSSAQRWNYVRSSVAPTDVAVRYDSGAERSVLVYLAGEKEVLPTVDGSAHIELPLAGEVTVSATTARTFYADPTRPNDFGDGLTPETARRTLSGACALASSGDLVVALPGVYSEGYDIQTAEEQGEDTVPSLRARVVVRPGVTLRSRDGAEATVICGEEELRCVFLCKDAQVSGFTICGGRISGSDNNVNCRGAGVHGYYSSNISTDGLVCDCIISNNVSVRSAAAQFGTYRRCRILENRASQIASAVRQGCLETCWVARNGDNATLYYCDAYDCTIGPGNGTSCVSECRNLKNTVLADNQGYSVSVALVNCALPEGKVNSKSGITETNCRRFSSAPVDGEGRPVAGSVAIDAGDVASIPAGNDVALDGTQRVFNGVPDIGCYEYDVRGELKEVLRCRRIEVIRADPGVTKAETGLEISSGMLVVRWTPGEDRRLTFALDNIGIGTLRAFANGEPLTGNTIRSSDPVEIAFSFVPAAAGDFVRLGRFSDSNGLVLIFR